MAVNIHVSCLMRTIFCLQAFLWMYGEVSGMDRMISIEYNPNCTVAACRNTTGIKNLVYVKAVGNDVIHYLWSSIGAPTMILATTPNDTKLHVDWEQLLNPQKDGNAIQFIPNNVNYSMAFIITRLIEYDDLNDKADLQKGTNVKSIGFEDLQWQNMNLTINETTHSAILNTTLYQPNLRGNGTVSIQFTAYDHLGRAEMLPHLQYTSNTTQIDFTIDHVQPSYNCSRFAVELLFVSGKKNSKHNITKHVAKSIDDEYTPGMFKSDELHLPAQSTSKYSSYAQWKPVCYSDSARDFTNALEANSYDTNSSNLYIPKSIIQSFYKLNDVDMTAFNISFGTRKDGFYGATKYISWTTNIGYGTPPEDQLSMLVIIVISAGLGLPVLVIIAGGAIVCIKKRKSKYKELTLVVN
ncbi:glycosylated lysosomal membrane protein A-like [Glandiceps talaboti]